MPALSVELSDLQAYERFQRFLEPLIRYHRYHVEGLHHIPEQGRLLLVANHCLATYDVMMMGAVVFAARRRIIRGMGHSAFFQVPGLREAVTASGMVEATPDAAKQLLEHENVVGVTPGGLAEAFRPSTERYTLRWERRMGFAKLAIATGSPVVLAANPRGDELYTVYPRVMSKRLSAWLGAPVPVMRGLGATLIPRPIRLTHHLSEPILPPRPDSSTSTEALVRSFHAQLTERMKRLMQEALAAD